MSFTEFSYCVGIIIITLFSPSFLTPTNFLQTFNDFFIRELKPGVRPIAFEDNDAVAVSAADCRLMAFNTPDDATRFWIKVHNLCHLWHWIEFWHCWDLGFQQNNLNTQFQHLNSVVVSSVSMKYELHNNSLKKPSWIYTGTKEFEVQYYVTFNSCIHCCTFETQMDLCNSTISIFSKQF
jgi:hypothetical protein